MSAKLEGFFESPDTVAFATADISTKPIGEHTNDAIQDMIGRRIETAPAFARHSDEVILKGQI